MRLAFFAIGLFFLLVVGCTQNPQPSPPESQPEAPVLPADETGAQQPAPGTGKPVSGETPAANESGWKTYSNIGITFDYPENMSMTEQLQNHPRSASITLQGKNVSEGAIIVAFFNVSEFPPVLPDPLDEAARVLEDDGNDPGDISGQAQAKGEISSYVSPNGLPLAEREFWLVSETSSGKNVTMHGYALEIYDAEDKAAYAARIFSADSEWTEEMKGRFVSSFGTGE
ncbi:MAG: hypothetical protein AB1324_04340 [Candidatus Micrarchaeota archaeon]